MAALDTQETQGIAKPEVVIASSLSLLSVLRVVVLSKYGAKFVFEVRDIWPLTAIVLGGYSPITLSCVF